jgi:hypothetical protein
MYMALCSDPDQFDSHDRDGEKCTRYKKHVLVLYAATKKESSKRPFSPERQELSSPAE